MSIGENRNVYVGHRYVPKIMGEWDNQIQYEGLSIVTYKGMSYTSKKYVPVGIDISNEEFWVLTGNYNAQVETYRRDVNAYKKETDQKIDNYKQETTEQVERFNETITKQLEEIVTVSVTKYGNDTNAFNQAFDFLKSVGGGTLLIPSGTYLIDPVVVSDLHNLTIINHGTLKAKSSGFKFIEFDNCSNLKLNNMVIDGNNKIARAILLLNCPNYQVVNGNIFNVGNETITDSAIGLGVGYSSDFGYINNLNIDYVHSSTVGSGICLSKLDPSVTDDEKIPKHTTIENCTIKDIAPREDGDGIKVLSLGLVDANLSARNCRLINCRKRGLKFQAVGCKSENNYIEFYESASAGIDFQRGHGSSLNDTIVNFTPASSVVDSPLDLIYACVIVSVGDVNIKGLKYYVKDDYNSLIGVTSSSCLVRFTWLENSPDDPNLVKNVNINDCVAYGLSRFLYFECDGYNITLVNNTIELLYNSVLVGNATLTNFNYKDNKIDYLYDKALLFLSNNLVLFSGDIILHDTTQKITYGADRNTDLRITSSRDDNPVNSRNYEQSLGKRFHRMPEVPSSFPYDNGVIFNSCEVGDICYNSNKKVITDSNGDYIIDKWVCTAVADSENTRGLWKPVKQLVI